MVSICETAGFSKIFSERTQRLIDMSKNNQFVRRGSDVSVSGKNGSKESAAISASSKKEHRRRQQYRKRRQECCRSVELVEIFASNEDELKTSAILLYNDLITQKSASEAYHSFLASLRQYFVGQTWSDGVEKLLKQFLSQQILLEASKLTEKYLKFSPDAPLSRKLDEYKLQVLLHLYALPANDAEQSPDNLETVVNLLRMIDFMADHKILLEFLEEDIFEIFFDQLPRHLTHLYEELGQPIPPELAAYADNDKNDESFFEPVVLPSPIKTSASDLKLSNEDSNQSCSSQQSSKIRKRPLNYFDNKHHTLITVPKSGAKKLKLGTKRRKNDDELLIEETEKIAPDAANLVKSSRRSLKFTQPTSTLPTLSKMSGTARTPKGKGKDGRVPETPVFHQVSLSENRRRKLNKLIKQHGSRQVINETPPRLWAKMPIRQSPRQHASTRALYSCAPTLLTQIQKGDAGGRHLFDNILEEADEFENSPNDLIYDDIPELFPIVDNNKVAAKSASSKKTKKDASRTPTTPLKSKIPPTTPLNKLSQKKNLRELCSPINSSSSSTTNNNTNNNFSMIPTLKIKLKRSESMESSTSSGQNSTTTTPRKLRNGVCQKNLLVSEYKLPSFATDNYQRYMTSIKKERNRPPKPGDDPFYARGTRRNSVFYENASSSSTCCYVDEQKAPKSRSGRKMKTSVEYFHLAHYLLNVKNKNPSSPVKLKNLQRTVNAPIKLNKKLRLAPKNGRKRAKLYGKMANANLNDSHTSSSSSADNDNDRRKLPSENNVDDEQHGREEIRKLKIKRLSSADTDCSEEIGGALNASLSSKTTYDVKNLKQEIFDDDDDEDSSYPAAPVAYNLRTKVRTMSECGGKNFSPLVGAKSRGSFDSASSSNGSFLRRNIFEWAEISSRVLIEDDVFSSSKTTATNCGPCLL